MSTTDDTIDDTIDTSVVSGSTVTLTIDNEQYVIDRHKLSHTLLYGSLMETCQDQQLVIPLVANGSSSDITDPGNKVLHDYISFLLPEQSMSRKTLVQCLQYCSLIGDQKYLWHNIKKLLFCYDHYKDIINSDNFNTNLLYDMYSYFPLHLVPQHLINNKIFLELWLSNIIVIMERDGAIYVNQKDKYEYEYNTYSDNANKIGSIFSYLNDKEHGLGLHFYANGQKEYEFYYNQGKKCGVHTRWDYYGNITTAVQYDEHGVPVPK